MATPYEASAGPAQDNPFAGPVHTEPPKAHSDDVTLQVPATDRDEFPAEVPQQQEPLSPGERTEDERSDIAFRDIALVTVASGFLIAETARECDDAADGCTTNMIWGLVCSVVGVVVGIAYIYVMRFGPGKRDPVKFAKVTPITSCVLLCFYTSAAGLLTFDAPYSATGNGYFFVWGAFLASAHAVYVAVDVVHNYVHQASTVVAIVSVERRMIAGCLIMSTVELIESGVLCSKYECTDKIEYGVAMGMIGVLFTIGLLVAYSHVEKFITYVSLLLTLLWGVAAVVLTFKGGPYNITGNGYFASWGAFFFAAALFFLTSRHLMKEAVQRLDNAIEGGNNENEEHNPYPAPTGHAQPAALPSPQPGNTPADTCPQIPAGSTMA